MKVSFAIACLLGLTSAEQLVVVGQPEDLPTCISDIEALIPGLESVIADFKAGDYDKALTDGLALLPDAEKAASDCLSGGKKMKLMKVVKSLRKIQNVQDLPTCISDIEALIPGVEGIIADFKAGDYDKALSDGLALLPDAEKAVTDCTSSSPFKKVKDTQQCIADIEGLIPGVEKVIADLKAGNQNAAILQLTLLLPKAEAAYKECTGSGKVKALHHLLWALKTGNPEDLPTCISDIEALIPGVEGIIADFKAGDYDKALSDGLALLPDAEKAVTDCTSSVAPKLMSKMTHIKEKLMKINVGDLPTCISDIEALIPGLESVIADFKAGDYDKALTDGLALLPDAEKAASDCLSSGKALKDRFKTILKDDPKREYFEKLGAEFASAFLAGTRVDGFESIDLYNCLHREPTAVEYFYKADEEIKYSFIKKDSRDAVKGLDEMIGFIIELVKEDYPHTHHEVCQEFREDRHADWSGLEKIIKAMKEQDTTLHVNSDEHWFFNREDITSSVHNLAEDYIHGDWSRLGYQYGQTLLHAVEHEQAGLFLY